MMFTMEFSAEDFKANKGKTLEELLNGGSKKPVKKPKVEEDADDDSDEEDADDDSDEEDADDDSEADIDADMIKEAISAAVKAKNQPKVEALFKKFKAKTVSGLKEAQYAKFYAELKPLTKKR